MHLEALTPTQFDVLRLMADGLNLGEIAAERGSSMSTIKRHQSAIYEALDCRGAMGAVVYWYKTPEVHRVEPSAKRRNGWKLKQETRAEIASLAKAGLTHWQIANRFGVCRSRVSQIVRELA